MTADDTDKLRNKVVSQSLDDRMKAVDAVGKLLGNDVVSETQRPLAHEILESLSHDSELRVRESLARTIADYPLLPSSLAERLAKDVMEVAVPVIEASPVLDDAFLADLIEAAGTNEETQVAVAKRPNLSEPVSERLLKHGTKTSVETVLANETASIAEAGYENLFAREDMGGSFLTLVAARSDLTEPVVTRCHKIVLHEMMDKEIGRQVRTQLVDRYQLPEPLAAQIVQSALEDALSKEASLAGAENGELDLFARRLHERGELTASLILRNICDGSLEFAISSLHVMSGMLRGEVHQIVHEAASNPIGKLYRSAGLDPYFRFAVTTALRRVATDPDLEGQPNKEKIVKDIVREIVGFYRNIGPSSLDQVIAHLAREAGRWKDSETTDDRLTARL